jgi:integrase/recombinase XerD
MGELYRKMERDLAIKNLAPVTRKEYLRCCCKFVRYHMRLPREMGVSEIKDFLGQLVREGAGPETLKMHVAGVKFLYGITLDRQQVADKIPWPKVPHKQPDILSLSEVERLLAAGAQSLIPSMVAMTAYAGGLRVGEACRLRPEDIDSTRMLIHVRLGKGRKDRFVMLSEHLLRLLRAYWKQAQPQGGWMFPGRKTGEPLSRAAVGKALKAAAQKAGIKKRITPHLLRHYAERWIMPSRLRHWDRGRALSQLEDVGLRALGSGWLGIIRVPSGRRGGGRRADSGQGASARERFWRGPSP